MNERTVAEIIGFPRNQSLCGMDACPVNAEPTVDDMLEWLQGNCPYVFDYGGKPGWFWVDSDFIDGTVRGPTLKAALEAAVRQVAIVLAAVSVSRNGAEADAD